MTPTGQPGWVLVVDDDATDRLLLFGLLERVGHHATVTDNGETALDLLRAEPFDLVLLDLSMPDLDGFAVLDAMRADSQLRHVPVIVISGDGEPAAVVRSIEFGAVGYLEKPVDPVLLRARVDATLGNVRLRRQHSELLDVVGHVAQAASGRDTLGKLDVIVGRPDPLGHSAGADRNLATELAEGPDVA